MKYTTKIITIDGPVASGKSTIARLLAQKLDFYYLYTGLLYRAVAYIIFNELCKKQAAEHFDVIADITYEYVGKVPHIYYRGDDITQALYDIELDQKTSIISSHHIVRDMLLDIQRTIGKKYNIVADGRDCGSVVFPTADVKFFLTADVATRAQRLLHDPKRAAQHMSLEQATQEITQRDTRDQTRAVAPLIIPDNAIVIDNTHMTLDQSLAEFLNIIDVRL